MDVGVRELKKRLSEFLEKAAKGEIIRVTDRGHAKVIIGPIPGLGELMRGIAQAWIRKGNGMAPAPIKRQRSKHATLEILLDDRG